MKRMFKVFFAFFICVLVLYAFKVRAILPLSGKTIIIDPGHGDKDPGTSYGKIYEKDINLSISLYLEKSLSKLGASVILIRDGDYDLSLPNAAYRKKSDFDNRIKMINESDADLYLSIHLNYLSNSSYYGPQVFYNKENEELAKVVQEVMNERLKGDREVKKIPNDTYMYSKLNKEGILIECGFLSNGRERELLKSDEYQKKIADAKSVGIIKYYQY